MKLIKPRCTGERRRIFCSQQLTIGTAYPQQCILPSPCSQSLVAPTVLLWVCTTSSGGQNVVVVTSKTLNAYKSLLNDVWKKKKHFITFTHKLLAITLTAHLSLINITKPIVTVPYMIHLHTASAFPILCLDYGIIAVHYIHIIFLQHGFKFTHATYTANYSCSLRLKGKYLKPFGRKVSRG